MKKRIVLLLLALLALSGCANSQTANTAKQPEHSMDDKEKEEIVYSSTVNDGECALCDKAGKTLLPLYDGQKNLGIICINTMTAARSTPILSVKNLSPATRSKWMAIT